LPNKALELKRGGCRSAGVVDLLPAIDIRHGRVVRLSQGEPTRQTVYGDDPLTVAEQFIEQGATWIHVVDLDRALDSGENQPAVRRVAQRVRSRVRLQLGGGFRSLELIRAGLDMGADRIVIGTAAAIDPGFIPVVASACGPGRLAVGIDARHGLVALRGWTETSSVRTEELAWRALNAGIETVIYTDIARDGMLRGLDLDGAVGLQKTGARVIGSGGIAGIEDIRAACAVGLAGVIVGRALYEGRFTLPQALEAARCSPESPPLK
jgi:phosphoribosylformimino-5-aminoimidazole carboxamide ribotide isomerase